MNCIWLSCPRPAARGDYCFEHYDLLVYSGAVEDKVLDEILARATQKAKAEVASRYPNNPDYRGWNDDEDDDGR